ncbi:MAG: hypothetical protein PHO20_02630 [Candidatus Peribacteraceae bacterium]|nr:hypothetical protein [Candidatus Peribacteraceae bacterium]MDD5739640.1 hypothetical protein [Candidatus Peribacteraceae bacterium]
METVETTVLDRASALVEQFQDYHGPLLPLQAKMNDALTGPFAEEIFGTELSSLQSAVDRMHDGDPGDINTTLYVFSRELLLKHQALLGCNKI